MWTTSNLDADKEISKELGVSLYFIKYLDREKVQLILGRIVTKSKVDKLGTAFVISQNAQGEHSVLEVSYDDLSENINKLAS